MLDRLLNLNSRILRSKYPISNNIKRNRQYIVARYKCLDKVFATCLEKKGDDNE